MGSDFVYVSAKSGAERRKWTFGSSTKFAVWLSVFSIFVHIDNEMKPRLTEKPPHRMPSIGTCRSVYVNFACGCVFVYRSVNVSLSLSFFHAIAAKPTARCKRKRKTKKVSLISRELTI